MSHDNTGCLAAMVIDYVVNKRKRGSFPPYPDSLNVSLSHSLTHIEKEHVCVRERVGREREKKRERFCYSGRGVA